MEIPGRVIVTMHTVNRIRLRFPPLHRFNQQEIIKQVEDCLPAAIALCDTQDGRKIVAAPICEADTIYLVTKVDEDSVFVITCLTQKMVQETIRQAKEHRHRAMSSCPHHRWGKQP